MKRYIALLFIFSLISQQSLIYSQSNYDIVLAKKGNAKNSYTVKTNKKASIYYYGLDGEIQKKKGFLKIKDESSIYCDSITFQIKDIIKIRAKTTNNTNKIVAAILAGMGISAETLGVVFIILATKNSYTFEILVELLMGLLGITVGVALLIAAIFVAAANAENFDLQNDWDLIIEPSS